MGVAILVWYSSNYTVNEPGSPQFWWLLNIVKPQPETDFEKQIATVLANSRNIEDPNEELTEAERQALMRISLEEVYFVCVTLL